MLRPTTPVRMPHFAKKNDADMTASRDNTFPCPHCGEDVPDSARVCRACGASDESGWNQDDFDIDGPDDDSGHPAAVGIQGESASGAVPMWVRLVILAVILSFILSLRLW